FLDRIERRNSAFSDRASKPALSGVKCSGQRRKCRLRQRRRGKFARWPRDLPFAPGEFGAVVAVGVWFGDQTASFDCHPFQYVTITPLFPKITRFFTSSVARRTRRTPNANQKCGADT